jgi:hypothetical protein
VLLASKQREVDEAAREATLRKTQQELALRQAKVNAAIARGEAPPLPPSMT